MHAFPTTTPAALPGGVEPALDIQRERDLGSLWRTLARRRTAVLRIFVGFVILMLVGTLLWPKQYMTDIKVITGNSNQTGANAPDSQLPVLNALLLTGGGNTAETYAELFKETPVVQRVIDELNLKTSPRELLNRVVVKPVTNTAILDVGVTWSDAKTSAAIANAFGQAIVDRQRDLVSSQARAALDALKSQMPLAQQRMNESQNKLSQFEAAHRIADIDAQTKSTIDSLAALDAKISSVQADRSQAQAQLSSSQGQLGHMSPTITGSTQVSQNPVVAQLQQQLANVDVQLRQAQGEFTDQHPTVIALRQQKDQLQRAIAQQQQTVVAGNTQVPNPVYQQLRQQSATYQAQIAADAAQITELQRQRGVMTPALAALPSQTAQLADLQRNAKASQDVYSALQQKFVNAQVASETAISDVTITQPANPREAQVRPSLLLNFLISLVLGAVLGVTGALLLDYFDNSIKDERQVEEELALPQLGAIPLVQLRNGEPVVPWVKALALESFLQLVTNTKYATDERLRSLAVVSPMQGDGKSTIALNIALALNEIEGPVLLVDADLRRPSLHAKLRLANERGLSDILVGQATLDQAIQIDEKSGLAILTSGTATPNPLKLLESPRFEALMEELQGRFQTVVFDGAALQGNVDSAVLARRVSGTILVVSHGSTDLRQASGAMKRLQRMGVRNILGFVLNRVEARRDDYTFYGGDVPKLYSDEAPIVAATR